MIIDLNRRLGLEGVFIEVIPHLITRLAVRDLDPKKFIDELSNGADLDQPIAQGATEEIERRILRPVEVPLRNEVGVDIKAIFLAKPPVTPPIYRPAPPPTNPNPTQPPIYRPSPSIPTPPPIPPKPVTPPEIPVKINVSKPEIHSIFDSDSWVNKLK